MKMYLIIIIVSLVVFVLFRLLYLLLRILPLSSTWKHYVGYLLPVVELTNWLGFIIWAIHYVYNNQDYTILIILGVLSLLLILPVGFLLRDFLFGVILKLQRKIEVDHEVYIEGIQGKVIKAGYFTFDIITLEGNIDTIPYNKIRSKVISRPGENRNLFKNKITFKFPSNGNIQSKRSILQKLLLNSPHVASSQPPIIGHMNWQNGEIEIEVFVYTLQAEYIEMIKEYVLKQLDGVEVSL